MQPTLLVLIAGVAPEPADLQFLNSLLSGWPGNQTSSIPAALEFCRLHQPDGLLLFADTPATATTLIAQLAEQLDPLLPLIVLLQQELNGQLAELLHQGASSVLSIASSTPVLLQRAIETTIARSAGMRRRMERVSRQYHGVLATQLGAAEQNGQADLHTAYWQALTTATQLEVLMQHAPVGFAVLDRQRRYLLVNERLARLNGRPVAEHLGRMVDEIAPALAEYNAAAVRHILATGEPIIGEQFDALQLGCPPPFGMWQISHYPVKHPNGGIIGVGIVIVDVTQQQRAFDEQQHILARERTARLDAERAANRIARLQAVTAALSGALTPNQVIDVLLSHAIEALNVAAGGVSLLTDDGQMLEVALMRGFPESVEQAWQRFSIHTPIPLVTAIQEQRAVWIESRAALREQYPLVASASQRWGAWAAVPMLAHNRVIGGLTLCFAEETVFDLEDRVLWQTIVQQCTQALERARLYLTIQQAHQDTEAARALLDSLISAAPVGIIFLDSYLRCQHINPRMLELSGLTQAIQPGAGLTAIFPELVIEIEPLLQHVLRTGQPVLDQELQLAASSGETRLTRSSYYPVRSSDGTILGLGAIFEDITPYRRMEMALRASQEREQARASELAAVLEAVPAAVWIAHDPQARLITGNRTSHALLRMPVGRNMSKSAPEHERPAHFHVLYDGVELAPEDLPVQRAARGEEVIHYEEQLVFDDGQVVTLFGNATPLRDAHGGVRGAVAAFLDISERKRVEQEHARLLVEAQDARARAEATASRIARLQAVTAALAEALTPLDVANVIVREGAAALDAYAGLVFLCSADGSELELLTAINYAPEHTVAWQRIDRHSPVPVAEAARLGVPILIPNRTVFGERYQVDVLTPTTAAIAAMPLHRGQETIGVLGLSFAEPQAFSPEDQGFMLALAQQCAQALERARLYTREQQARADAEAALRMRDVFFSVAAHELRTPLTVLLGQAQLLLRRVEREEQLDQRIMRSVTVIADQASRMNTMISSLLDVTRIARGHLALDLAPVELGSLLQRLLEEVQPTLQIHQLRLQPVLTPLVVQGDALRLEQVLHNLISNAVKYSPSGGSIEMHATQHGTEVCVSVTDHGIGIPESALPQLFQRFFRASNADTRHISGMGIGLYVVKEIIELHAGRVTVESIEGRGSTFSIWLPLIS